MRDGKKERRVVREEEEDKLQREEEKRGLSQTDGGSKRGGLRGRERVCDA